MLHLLRFLLFNLFHRARRGRILENGEGGLLCLGAKSIIAGSISAQ
jgi:hypothetical protein